MWGEPDDIEPLPDWMLPDNHPQKRNIKMNRHSSKSLEEIAAEVLKKPPVPIIIKEPGDLK
jgi:hypothetical protein